MGFIDNKNNVVQQISVFEVLGKLPKNRITSSFDSVTSKRKNLLPFMLDLLTITCKDDTTPRKASLPSFDSQNFIPPSQTISPRSRGKCEITRIIVSIIIEFFPVLIRIVKEGIVKALKSSLVCPADFRVPNPPQTVTLTADEVDFSKLMKVDPNSFPGNLLFGDPETDLNLFISNLIQSGGSASWKNLLDFNYNQTNETMDVSINGSYSGQPFDTFLSDFINSIELINKKNLLPLLMNQLFGSIDNSLPNFDIESSVEKEKLDKMVEKILDTDPCEEEFIFDNSFFEFSNDELLDINKRANDRNQGTIAFDGGCSPYTPEVDFSVLRELSENLDDSNSTNVNLVNEEYLNTFLSDLSGEEDGNNQNQENSKIKKNLSVKMATALPKLFTDVIFTPKIVVLNQVSQKLITDTTTPNSDKFDYAKANKVFFEFVVRESMAALLQVIFNQIKREILKLVTSLAVKLIKEAAEKRVKQLLSLVGGSSITSGITSVISTPEESQFL